MKELVTGYKATHCFLDGGSPLTKKSVGSNSERVQEVLPWMSLGNTGSLWNDLHCCEWVTEWLTSSLAQTVL